MPKEKGAVAEEKGAVVKEKGAVAKEKGATPKEKENREFSLRVKEHSSKPLVGQIDPFLIKNRG